MKELANYAKGGGKGKPPGKSVQFLEIADHIKMLLDNGETLSSQMKAKLIKFKLLMMKQNDLDRREEEKKVSRDIVVLLECYYPYIQKTLS